MEKIKINNKLIAEIHFLTDKKEIKNKEVVKIIKDVISKCNKHLPLMNKKIAIYSSTGKFIKNKMGGVGADALQENVINLYINPVSGWKKELKKSIAHEYSHLAILDVRKWKTLSDSLIIEGIAEVFREEIVLGEIAPWSKALTKKEAISLFKKLKHKLNIDVKKIHRDLFFGSKDYKMWSGYSLGYYIVKDFRNIYPNIPWKNIIRFNSSEILKKSGFINKN